MESVFKSHWAVLIFRYQRWLCRTFSNRYYVWLGDRKGVKLSRASGNRIFHKIPWSAPATSPEVLSLWNSIAIQRFLGSFPDFPATSPQCPGSLPDFLGSSPDFPGGYRCNLSTLNSHVPPLLISKHFSALAVVFCNDVILFYHGRSVSLWPQWMCPLKPAFEAKKWVFLTKKFIISPSSHQNSFGQIFHSTARRGRSEENEKLESWEIMPQREDSLSGVFCSFPLECKLCLKRCLGLCSLVSMAMSCGYGGDCSSVCKSNVVCMPLYGPHMKGQMTYGGRHAHLPVFRSFLRHDILRRSPPLQKRNTYLVLSKMQIRGTAEPSVKCRLRHLPPPPRRKYYLLNSLNKVPVVITILQINYTKII